MFDFESTLFVHEEGKVISKAPRNEIPKNMNNIKTKILKAALLEIWYKVFLPKTMVRINPRIVKMAMIETE